MPDFSIPAPIEPNKSGEYLHDRGRLPAPPPLRAPRLMRRYLGLGLGALFALGFLALAFQTRASWETHRDWVVPVTVPAWVAGGVALGYLIDRRQWLAMAPGAGMLFFGVTLTAMNIWRGQVVDGPDALRDALTITTAVVLVLALVALLAGLLWVEVTRPLKAPPPEV